MHYELIMLAAGQGKRMNASKNKILLHLSGKPILLYSLECFLHDPACQHIILVVQKEEKELMQAMIKKYFPNINKTISIVIGGKERQDSVYQGLLVVKKPEEIIFIHDGARPFITLPYLKQLYKKALVTKAAILGVPVKDTIKKVIDGKVKETISREDLWQIQTPQAFVASELKKAHEDAQNMGFLGTDDASLMELFGQREIAIILGSYENIKVTTPEDMLIGEAIIKRRRKN